VQIWFEKQAGRDMVAGQVRVKADSLQVTISIMNVFLKWNKSLIYTN